MERLRSGSVVDGYVLTELIGAGGFASVYKARAVAGWGEFGSVVAIKILHPRRAEGLEIGRFKEEARTILALQHEYIIRVYAFREIEENFLIFMEFIDTDLRRFTTRRPFTEEEILSILRRTAQGLRYAHSRGIVHRDFNPSNILVSWSLDTLKITDFGIAGRSNPLWRNLLPNKTDPTSGTRGYFAPEQYRGYYDERTDIYAFGRTIRSLFRHSNLPLPRRLEKMVEIATREDPKDRYQSMDEIIYALEMTEKMAEDGGWLVPEMRVIPKEETTQEVQSEDGNSLVTERVAGGKNFILRMTNHLYPVNLVRKEPGGQIIFSLVGEERLKKQVLQAPGEVVFQENGQTLVSGVNIRSIDSRLLLVSGIQMPRPERRIFNRVGSLSLTAKVVSPGVFRSAITTVTILNLSPGGVRLKSGQRLNQEREYTLEAILNGKPWQAKFTICGAEEKGQTSYYSGRFTVISDRDARRLEDFLHEMIWGSKPAHPLF
ncbi:MAG: serine/threonine protein kinase [Candidatus Omnitrophica bacterium]|nr:serine/threonine protein kinase [Candidatus Omnitrophota bacterium]